MTERRKLFTGEESAGRGLLLLRLASVGALLLTGLFIFIFYRAKYDPALSSVNPFAEDPYDAVGSFGVQLGVACAILSALRAFRTNLKTESLYNRYTYTLRAMAVSQLAIIVTMLADLVALVRYSSLWIDSPYGHLLVLYAGGLFFIASGFCFYLMRLAKRRDVCSQNPLRQPQIVPFLILLGLLGIYPGGWRDGITGAIFTAIVGMVMLFFSVALLSRAMYPCPDVPEKDLIDDLYGIYQNLKRRSGYLARLTSSIEHMARSTQLGRIIDLLNPRKHEWNLLALVAILMGFLLAFAETFSRGPSPGAGQTILVAIVLIVLVLESAGVFLGYALLRRFLGLIRPA
jgi:hypothetical protein